jgi:hypothetical protein
MNVIARHCLASKERAIPQDIIGLKLPELLFALYHPTFLVEYLSFKQVKSHHEHHRESYMLYKTLLADLLEPFADYPPLVYLMTSKIFNYAQNKHHLCRIHETMIDELQ